MQTMFHITIGLALIISSIYWAMQEVILNGFSKNEDVKEELLSHYIITVVTIASDFGRGIMVGVIRALERQGMAFKFNFSISWFIMIPLCYILPILADMKLAGVFTSFLIGQFFL